MGTVTLPKLTRSGPRGAWARYANMLIGFWLVLSAFLWRHTPNEQAGAWGSGILIFLFAIWSLMDPAMRVATGLTGAWLAITSFFVPLVTSATAYNHIICGAVVVLLSLVPGERWDFGEKNATVPRVRRM